MSDTYTSICVLETNLEGRLLDKGTQLKAIFLTGPSEAVMQHGKVTIVNPSDSQSNQNNNQQSQTQNQQSSNNDQPGGNSDSGNNSQGSQSSSGESHANSEGFNYSILNSYMNLRRVYEADSESGSGSGNNSSAGSNSGNNSGQDSQPAPTVQDTLRPGSKHTIKVELPGEGCTEYTIQLDSRVESKWPSIKSALESKKFKAAFDIASKSVESDGFAVLRAETKINDKNALQKCPFIGKCKWAIDAGSDSSSGGKRAEKLPQVSLAIAAIDAITNKASEDYIYEAVFDIVGDVAGGTIGKLKALFASNSDQDRYSGSYNNDNNKKEDFSDELSAYIHSTLTTPGDSSMYNDFKKARKFIDEKVKAKTLKYSDYYSADAEYFEKKLKAKHAFAVY